MENSAPEPRISILIPSFNGEKFIRGTLDTIASQSYKNWEAIIVDGGSTDGSLEILKEYAEDPRFRVYSESDEGPYHAIHKAFAKARGEFVCIVAISDGYLDDDWFRKALEVFDRDKEVSLVWGIPMDVTEGGEVLGPNYIYAHFLRKEGGGYDNPPVVKKIVKKFNPRGTSSLIGSVMKLNRYNFRVLRYMLGDKKEVPQKEGWFKYWLKTGSQFPDGNMLISKRVYKECLPPYRGKSEPGNQYGFYFNFYARGYLAECIPIPASIGRMHKGQRNDTLQKVNDASRRIYLKKVSAFRRLYEIAPTHFVFRERNGNPINVK